MNKKGITLLELMIILAIIGIILSLILHFGVDNVHGMEINKLVAADNDTTKVVITLLKQDPHLTVTILTYSAIWDMEKVDPLMNKSKKLFRTIADSGISAARINWAVANKGGLEEDPMPTPTTDGVYLYLD